MTGLNKFTENMNYEKKQILGKKIQLSIPFSINILNCSQCQKKSAAAKILSQENYIYTY